VPTFSFVVENVALPAETVTVPSEVAPSLNVTLPEMVPATFELTDAERVTAWPKVEGFREDVSVVVVAAACTVCVVAAELAR